MRKSLSFSTAAVLLAGLMVTSFGAFAAKVSLEMTQKNDNNYPVRYALVVEDACDADFLKFNIYDDGEKADFGKLDKVEIPKSNEGKTCRLNRELSPKDINGKVLEVRLHKNSGNKVGGNLYVRVPCENNALQMARSQNGGVHNLKNEAKDFSCPKQSGAGGWPPAATNGQQQQPQQSCSINAGVEASNRERVRVTATCDLNAKNADVLITQGNRIVERNTINFSAGERTNVAPLIPRPAESTIAFKVEIRTKNGETFSKNMTIRKDPTFNHKPTAQVLSGHNMTPAPKGKSMGRGTYWPATIQVRAYDNDIEEEFPQEAILVQLINAKTGAIIGETEVSTGQTAQFDVEAQFIEPLVFGSAKWDTSAALQKGENVLKVRVYDAYQKKGYIDLAVIKINVVSDK